MQKPKRFLNVFLMCIELGEGDVVKIVSFEMFEIKLGLIVAWLTISGKEIVSQKLDLLREERERNFI